ncbi:MAG: MBL fold metallo-hydrolase [Salinirussus sp.]
MRLTFLGTGSAMPTGERFQTGLLVEACGDALLVDCGSGVLHGLARTGRGYEGIDTVLFTHHHLDHVSDLFALMKARWLAGEEELTVRGPPGTPALVDGLLGVHDYMQDRLDLALGTVEPTDGDPIDVSGFAVRAMETRHSMDCLAYRLGHPDAAGSAELVFTGDSEAFPGLIEFADGAAVLVHDCSFPDGVDVSNHPTPTALGEALAAADADLGRVYLTHRFPHSEGKGEEMLSSIGRHYEGDVRLARDGLTVELSS